MMLAMGWAKLQTSQSTLASAKDGTIDQVDDHLEESGGSCGLVHIRDDEKRSEFEVWRIWEGDVSEHADPFFATTKSKQAFFDDFEEPSQ
jgi:hypothetical protein